MPPTSPMGLGTWLATSLLLPIQRLNALARPLAVYAVPAVLIEALALQISGGVGWVLAFPLQLVAWLLWSTLGVRAVRLALFDKPATPKLFMREDAAAYLVTIILMSAQIGIGLLSQTMLPDPAAVEAGTVEAPGTAALAVLVVMVLAIYLSIRFLFAFAAAASGAPTPFATSWNLTRGAFWRLLGRVLLLLVPIAVGLGMTVAPILQDGGQGIVAFVVSVLLSIYVLLSMSIGVALLFQDYAPPDGMAQLRERVAAEPS